jgi:hypothetical protein
MLHGKRIFFIQFEIVSSTKFNKTLTHDYKMAIISLSVHEPTKSK